MLTTIQIFLLAIVLFAFSRVLFRHRDKIISTKAALFWSIIWLAAVIGILLPKTTTSIAQIFGVGRGVDVIVYVSLTLLFYLVFRIYVMIEDIRRDITQVIREFGLKNSSSKSKKRHQKGR